MILLGHSISYLHFSLHCSTPVIIIIIIIIRKFDRIRLHSDLSYGHHLRTATVSDLRSSTVRYSGKQSREEFVLDLQHEYD